MFFLQVSLFLKDRSSPTAVHGHFVPVWMEPGCYPENWLWGLLSAPGHVCREKGKHACTYVGVKQCYPATIITVVKMQRYVSCPRSPPQHVLTSSRGWLVLIYTHVVASVCVILARQMKPPFCCASLPSTTLWYCSKHKQRLECRQARRLVRPLQRLWHPTLSCQSACLQCFPSPKQATAGHFSHAYRARLPSVLVQCPDTSEARIWLA